MKADANEPMGPNVEFLTAEEAAEFFRMTVGALHQMRSRGGGPRALKPGKRLLFKRSDLIEWLESQYEVAR